MINSFSSNLLLAFKGELDISQERDAVYVSYTPKTDRALFDICDMQGRVVRTGRVESKKTRIETKDLKPGHYLMWVVDAGEVVKTKFKLTPDQPK